MNLKSSLAAVLCLSALLSLSACTDKKTTTTETTDTNKMATDAATAPTGAPSLVEGDEAHQMGAKSHDLNAKDSAATTENSNVSNSATGNTPNVPPTGTIKDTTDGTASAAPADRRIPSQESARQACQEQNPALAGKDLDTCIAKRLKATRM